MSILFASYDAQLKQRAYTLIDANSLGDCCTTAVPLPTDGPHNRFPQPHDEEIRHLCLTALEGYKWIPGGKASRSHDDGWHHCVSG